MPVSLAVGFTSVFLSSQSLLAFLPYISVFLYSTYLLSSECLNRMGIKTRLQDHPEFLDILAKINVPNCYKHISEQLNKLKWMQNGDIAWKHKDHLTIEGWVPRP